VLDLFNAARSIGITIVQHYLISFPELLSLRQSSGGCPLQFDSKNLDRQEISEMWSAGLCGSDIYLRALFSGTDQGKWNVPDE